MACSTPATRAPTREPTTAPTSTHSEPAARPASTDAPAPRGSEDAAPRVAESAGGAEPIARDVSRAEEQSDSPPPAGVSVTGIGMHIGGGPNDTTTKAPFAAAIDAKTDDFRRCYAKLDSPAARGTFGVDLMIPKAGGHPATSNVRTVLPGDVFRTCMTAVFESIDFARPKHGRTKLSYALRLGPAEQR